MSIVKNKEETITLDNSTGNCIEGIASSIASQLGGIQNCMIFNVNIQNFLQGCYTANTDGAMLEEREMLTYEQHCRVGQIWQEESGKQLYKVYVTPPNGERKLLTCKTKEGLENKISNFKNEMMNIYNPQTKTATVESMLPEFISYKAEESSPSNADRLKTTYNRYYKDTEISKEPLKDVKATEVRKFFTQEVVEKELTKRQFLDMKSFLKMLFDYALEEEIISGHNIIKDITVIDNKFKPRDKKDASKQVFVNGQDKRIQELALKMFEQTQDTAYLAICADFKLGCRVGELSTLKVEDYDGKILHINSSEKKYYSKDETGILVRNGVRVDNHTKTPESQRDIPVTKTARELLNRAIALNKKRGFDSPYIFTNSKGNRITAEVINKRLRNICNRLGLDVTGVHAIRKTCISNMYATHELTDEDLRSFAGHTSIKTTQQCYIYATSTLENRFEAFERALESVGD